VNDRPFGDASICHRSDQIMEGVDVVEGNMPFILSAFTLPPDYFAAFSSMHRAILSLKIKTLNAI
jgi:hypothetical protein